MPEDEKNVYADAIARSFERRTSSRVERAKAIMRGEEPPKRPNYTGGQLREPVVNAEAQRIADKYLNKSKKS